MLNREGYDAATAADEIEALKILKSGGVQVVLTDLRMPNLDGVGVMVRKKR